MVRHSDIRREIASEIANDTQILAIAREAFGRGVVVMCDRWAADGLPGESDCPACFVFSDGSGDAGQSDESTYNMVVRFAAVTPEDVPVSDVVAERSATANGLLVCAGARAVEAMRDRTLEVLRDGPLGAYIFQSERYENTFAGWPLMWSDLALTMFEPEVLPPCVSAETDAADMEG